MKVTRTSPLNKREITLDLNITQEQIDSYNNGALLQDAFPNLSADDREFYKTGITGDDWDLMFNGSDEEDE